MLLSFQFLLIVIFTGYFVLDLALSVERRTLVRVCSESTPNIRYSSLFVWSAATFRVSSNLQCMNAKSPRKFNLTVADEFLPGYVVPDYASAVDSPESDVTGRQYRLGNAPGVHVLGEL